MALKKLDYGVTMYESSVQTDADAASFQGPRYGGLGRGPVGAKLTGDVVPKPGAAKAKGAAAISQYGGDGASRKNMGITSPFSQSSLYIRPRYGTRIRPVQDIAAIYIRSMFATDGKFEREFLSRDFSVQGIAYQRTDLHEVYSTFPANVFANFRSSAPIMVAFSCKILNALDFEWEKAWNNYRNGRYLNPRWLAANSKILEIRVDGLIYVGYIISDSIQKTIEMEGGPSLTFQFLCLQFYHAAVMYEQNISQLNLTESYYVDADFRQFTTRYLTSAEVQKDLPPEYRAYWRNYVGWVQDDKDLKKAEEETFLKKFWKGIKDYVADPQKAMVLVQALASGDGGVIASALGNLGSGALEAGLLSGAQGTPFSGMVNAMLENGMAKKMVTSLFREDWGTALYTFTGMSQNVLQSTSAVTLDNKLMSGKAVKSWGGATIGMGAWSQRQYYGAKRKNKTAAGWGSGASTTQASTSGASGPAWGATQNTPSAPA